MPLSLSTNADPDLEAEEVLETYIASLHQKMLEQQLVTREYSLRSPRAHIRAKFPS